MGIILALVELVCYSPNIEEQLIKKQSSIIKDLRIKIICKNVVGGYMLYFQSLNKELLNTLRKEKRRID